MIRILHVIGSLNCGGSQMMVMNLYRNIDREKVQFDFIIDKKDELFFAKEIESLGGKIYILPEFKGYNIINYCLSWKRFFKEHKEYKIIHAHVRSTASIFLSIAKKYGLIKITHSHNNSSGKGYKAMIKNILQFPLRYIGDYFFACSIDAGKWLYGQKVTKSENFKIINNAIDLKQFEFNEVARQDLRKELSIENNFVIGNVGRFSIQKNHLFMVEVFSNIKKKVESAKLLLVGDGELFTPIKNRVQELNLDDSVIFLGSRGDVPHLLQAMDVFIFPSIYEGFGMVALEAQASGLPCIVADTIQPEVCITDLIERVKLSDLPECWANHFVKYYNQNNPRPIMTDILKEKGFDIKENVDWLQNFYIDILNKERS